uniref:Uncharacterized protein n=1 Tax=Anopheles darlingi TaxID=43151 RepID=A0A2M4DNI0_ANODA
MRVRVEQRVSISLLLLATLLLLLLLRSGLTLHAHQHPLDRSSLYGTVLGVSLFLALSLSLTLSPSYCLFFCDEHQAAAAVLWEFPQKSCVCLSQKRVLLLRVCGCAA